MFVVAFGYVVSAFDAGQGQFVRRNIGFVMGRITHADQYILQIQLALLEFIFTLLHLEQSCTVVDGSYFLSSDYVLSVADIEAMERLPAVLELQDSCFVSTQFSMAHYLSVERPKFEFGDLHINGISTRGEQFHILT